MEIPDILKKFLSYKQETISSARWLTSANGYLRIFQNNLFADMIDLENLVTIVNFIVDVYAPFWFQIHLNPRLPSGPANILFARDLLLGHENEELFHHILPYFQSHALTWLSPKNVCVSVCSESPPMPIEDVRKIRTMHVDVEDLLWSSRPLRAFFYN